MTYYAQRKTVLNGQPQHDDDIALIATDVRANVLVGKEETVLIF